MSEVKSTRAQRQRRALEILAGEPEELTGLQLWERVVAEIPTLPEEEGVVKDGVTPRARVTWLFETSKQSLAGWIAKSTVWRATSAGRQALVDHPDPEDFWSAAVVAGQEWLSLQDPAAQPELTDDTLASVIIPAYNDHAARRAARAIIDAGLGQGDSLFLPGSGAWGLESVEELYQRYNLVLDESSDKFLDKLARQLDGASDAAVVLAAEIVALLSLPLENVSDATKRHRMRTILGWMRSPAGTPIEVSAGFMQGSWHGGTGANTQLWKALRDIVAFSRDWWTLPDDRRSELLEDPWAWGEHVQSSPALTMPSTRHTLNYLAFPTAFLPIISDVHRAKVRTHFADRVPDEVRGDTDRELFAITTSLQAESGGRINYYAAPWLAQWDPETARKHRRAWLIRGSSVSGKNLVPIWLEEGFVSLPGTQLPEVPDPYDRTALRAAIDEGYASRTSSYRRTLASTYDRFLGQMRGDDFVLTSSERALHVGRVTGEPELVDADEFPARLRRAVNWLTPPAGVAVADLPDPLPKRLGIAGDVVDLSEDLDVIEAWIDGGLGQTDPPVDPVKDPRLDPTPPVPVALGPLRAADPTLAKSLHLTVEWLDRAIRLLDRRKQVILYGPPGTGKTFIAQALAEHLTDEGNVTLVQFHPSYAYEDFVMGYRPVTEPTDADERGSAGAVRFALKNGPLMRIAEQARDNKGTPHVLIIDEINRANLAKVFGELYFLLEYRDRAINLLYSEEDSEDFYLPENLFLIGTMNTADRSIALVDAAMRRRFAFLELHPSVPPVSGVLRSWLTDHDLPAEAADLLDALNSRVADKDFRIGPSYFMKKWIHTDADGLETVWETDLLPLLEEHHAGDGTDVPRRYGLGTVRAMLARSAEPPEDEIGS